MKALLRFLGCRCPVCSEAIPFAKATALLGNEDTKHETEILRCAACGSAMRASGKRVDQFIMLCIVHLVPQAILYSIFGTAAAVIWSVGLFPFTMRFIPLEPA